MENTESKNGLNRLLLYFQDCQNTWQLLLLPAWLRPQFQRLEIERSSRGQALPITVKGQAVVYLILDAKIKPFEEPPVKERGSSKNQ